MKYSIVLFTSVLISFNSFCQEKELFREDFTNNSNSWLEGKENIRNLWSEGNDSYSEKFFRVGQYCIINHASGFLTWSTKTLKIDQNEDFSIETSISLNWEKEGDAILIFGKDESTKNFHCIKFFKRIKNVTVTKTEVFVGQMIDGEWVGTWKMAKLQDYGVPNLVKIVKKGSVINYYLNGIKVDSRQFTPFHGDEIGIGCTGRQSISVDYLVVKQDVQNIVENNYYETNRSEPERGTKHEAKLRKVNGVYEVPVVLNGVLMINFIFDSGASDVSISPDVAMTLVRTGTIKDEDWLEGAYYKFADGSIAKSMRFNLKSVTIGGRTVYNVTCSISNSMDAPMLLGQSVLSKFGKYTFDYNSEILIIE